MQSIAKIKKPWKSFQHDSDKRRAIATKKEWLQESVAVFLLWKSENSDNLVDKWEIKLEGGKRGEDKARAFT